MSMLLRGSKLFSTGGGTTTLKGCGHVCHRDRGWAVLAFHMSGEGPGTLDLLLCPRQLNNYPILHAHHVLSGTPEKRGFIYNALQC